MTAGVIFFLFAVSANLFLMMLAGASYFIPREEGGSEMKNWYMPALQLFIWGGVAFTIRHLVLLIPSGAPFFLPAFAGIFILVRALISALVQQSFQARLREKIMNTLDDAIVNPMLLIPVFYIGYNDVDALATLLLLLSSWVGCRLAYGIFVNIVNRLRLESPSSGLDTSGKFLLTAALMALIASGLDQAFFSQLLK